jgi:hypothetical protein
MLRNFLYLWLENGQILVLIYANRLYHSVPVSLKDTLELVLLICIEYARSDQEDVNDTDTSTTSRTEILIANVKAAWDDCCHSIASLVKVCRRTLVIDLLVLIKQEYATARKISVLALSPGATWC